MDADSFTSLFNYIPSHGGAIGQSWGPLFWLVNKVESIKPHVIIEIGVSIGGSMWIWNNLLKENDLYIGVDIEPKTKEMIFWDWKSSNRRLEIVVGDSMNPETYKKVGEILGNLKADFLFIDGSHTYDIVKKDFNNYSPFVRSGGIVGFHDIESHLPAKWVVTGVKKFFFELEGKKEQPERWMRPSKDFCPMCGIRIEEGESVCHNCNSSTSPVYAEIKEEDSPFIKDMKKILQKQHHLTGTNGLKCTGIWWKP